MILIFFMDEEFDIFSIAGFLLHHLGTTFQLLEMVMMIIMLITMMTLMMILVTPVSTTIELMKLKVDGQEQQKITIITMMTQLDIITWRILRSIQMDTIMTVPDITTLLM